MLVAAGPFDSYSTVTVHRFVAECRDASVGDSVVLVGFAAASCFAFTYFTAVIDSASAATECSSPCLAVLAIDVYQVAAATRCHFGRQCCFACFVATLVWSHCYLPASSAAIVASVEVTLRF